MASDYKVYGVNLTTELIISEGNPRYVVEQMIKANSIINDPELLQKWIEEVRHPKELTIADQIIMERVLNGDQET